MVLIVDFQFINGFERNGDAGIFLARSHSAVNMDLACGPVDLVATEFFVSVGPFGSRGLVIEMAGWKSFNRTLHFLRNVIYGNIKEMPGLCSLMKYEIFFCFTDLFHSGLMG